MVSFEKMLFDYNEGMHHLGLMSGRYYTGYDFFLEIITMALLAYGFVKIICPHKLLLKYEKATSILAMGSISVMLIANIASMIYYEKYGAVLIITAFIVITLAVVTLDIFEPLREYLDEKFGWMF